MVVISSTVENTCYQALMDFLCPTTALLLLYYGFLPSYTFDIDQQLLGFDLPFLLAFFCHFL